MSFALTPNLRGQTEPVSEDRPQSLDALRSDLRERGISFKLFVNDQFQVVARNGADSSGAGQNAASMDAFVILDFDTLGIIDDAEALLHLQSNWGDGINPQAGTAFQVNDDADGDLGLHVAQLWYRQHFLDRRMSLTVGFLDFQTIVDRNAFANSEDKQFMNQMLDNNPIVPLNIGLGASLTFRPTDWYTFTFGAGDAQSVLYKPGFSTAFHDENWWIGYMEHALQVDVPSAQGPLRGNYRVGLIYDPRPRSEFGEDPPRSKGDDYGVYLSFDQKLYRESDQDDQGLGAFFRFGYRTPQTNRIARFWSAGLEYRGLVPGRNQDVAGFAWASARTSKDLLRRVMPSDDSENVYEIYYAARIADPLVVTFDLQYIDNPGATGEIGSALVAGIRARFSF